MKTNHSIKKNLLAVLFTACVSVSLAACGGGGAGGADDAVATDNSTQSVGAAMGAVFGGGQSASLSKASLPYRLVSLLVREAQATSERQTACEVIAEGQSHEDDVESTGTVTAGTYGQPDDAVTVTEEDGCDEGGDYASFVVTSHTFDCTDSVSGDESTVTMDTGTGVWRENIEDGITEIYGTFTITGDAGTTVDVRCSLIIDHTGEDENGAISGTCVDDNDEIVEQTSDMVCTD